jgi:hypothetical protein
METEAEQLLHRIGILDTLLANLSSNGSLDRGEFAEAVKAVRTHDIGRLRELGHHISDAPGPT